MVVAMVVVVWREILGRWVVHIMVVEVKPEIASDDTKYHEG